MPKARSFLDAGILPDEAAIWFAIPVLMVVGWPVLALGGVR